jgi:hypothetical protein
MNRISIAVVLLLCVWSANAQKITATVGGQDSASMKQAGPAHLQPYKTVITDKAISRAGLFTVHNINDKWYFEIADSLIGRQFLVVTRYSGTPGGSRFYGGEMANEETVYWERMPDNKLALRVNIYVVSATDSTQAISKAVRSSSVDPIVATFDIKTINPENKALVIDVTDFFKGDNQVVSLSAFAKKSNSLGVLAADKSFITKINTYLLNTEVHTIKTFIAAPVTGGAFFGPAKPIPAAVETGFVTLEMNNSFLLLPKVPMRKRLFDARVGYFADQFTQYDDSSEEANELQYIVRWRLEPRKEDMEKFRRGELVEPEKPLVYYIDPATPKKWRPYLIAGINDWQKAFEQAGFKNAIIGKEWPENDTTMSLEDARFSVIRYFASDITNAYGPNVHDPRSGEILESHIGWYHNVMTLVHDWYMIQAGAIDPKARKMEFDDTLMGQLIRFVSSHEIGHTLGLRHNMGSSSQTPVEKLRDKAWVEANGHTVSIMDYARFNYVAQPEDHIGEAGIFPRIGAYDKWAIQWGYTPIPATKNEEEDKKILNRLIVDSLTADPRLWFGGEGGVGDPRSQSEDLGDDAMKASDYGILNLKRDVQHLPEWTRQEGDLYTNMERIYTGIQSQYKLYMFHVAKNIGGAYTTIKSVEEKGVVFQPVPKPVLQKVVDFYDRQLFQTPLWLYSDTVVHMLGIRILDNIGTIQGMVLNHIMSAAALLQVSEMANLSKDPYTLDEYLTDMERAIWREVYQKSSIDIYRRNLQKKYLECLGDVLNPPGAKATGGFMIIEPGTTASDAQSIVRGHLASLNTAIAAALPLVKDKMTRYHLQDVQYRIAKMLDPQK